jgi:hypothetical protein
MASAAACWPSWPLVLTGAASRGLDRRQVCFSCCARNPAALPLRSARRPGGWGGAARWRAAGGFGGRLHKEAGEGQGRQHDDGRSILARGRQHAVHLGDEDTADDGGHPQAVDADTADVLSGRDRAGNVRLLMMPIS